MRSYDAACDACDAGRVNDTTKAALRHAGHQEPREVVDGQGVDAPCLFKDIEVYRIQGAIRGSRVGEVRAGVGKEDVDGVGVAGGCSGGLGEGLDGCGGGEVGLDPAYLDVRVDSGDAAVKGLDFGVVCRVVVQYEGLDLVGRCERLGETEGGCSADPA